MPTIRTNTYITDPETGEGQWFGPAHGITDVPDRVAAFVSPNLFEPAGEAAQEPQEATPEPAATDAAPKRRRSARKDSGADS